MFGFGHSGGNHGGSLADVLFVPDADHMLIQAPRSLPDVGLAMLTDNAVDAYRSVGPPLAACPGADVLIVAATPGSIALYATALALTLGAGSVRYVDRDPQRIDIARELGADTIVDAVDDPVITSTSGEQADERSDERRAESARILPDRSPHDAKGILTCMASICSSHYSRISD